MTGIAGWSGITTDPDQQLKFSQFGMYGVRKSSTAASKLPTTNGGNGLFYNKITEPIIKINYRGATLDIPVDIWTKVEQITPVYKSPKDDGSLDVSAKLVDNDVAGQDAFWYSKQVEVYAYMSSARGNVGTESNNGRVLLEWGGISTLAAFSSGRNTEATEKAGYAKPVDGSTIAWWLPESTLNATSKQALREQTYINYGMDFGLHAKRNTDNTWSANGQFLTDKGLPIEQTAWGQTNTVKNNGTSKNVNFYYSTPWSSDNGMTAASAKILKGTLLVNWSNIQTN